jgi:probable rRNA maturation factor
MIELSYDASSPELPSDGILDAMREAAAAAAGERGMADAEISLSFVSPDEIRSLNREHRGVDEVTDVLSFPMDGADADAAALRTPDDDDADTDAAAPGPPDDGDGDTDAAAPEPPDDGDGDADAADPEPPNDEDADTDAAWPDPPALLGDIVICPERAREQAYEYGHGEPREFVYLFVHGMFHLLGYDHETEDGRAGMRAAEEDIMRRVNL